MRIREQKRAEPLAAAAVHHQAHIDGEDGSSHSSAINVNSTSKKRSFSELVPADQAASATSAGAESNIDAAPGESMTVTTAAVESVDDTWWQDMRPEDVLAAIANALERIDREFANQLCDDGHACAPYGAPGLQLAKAQVNFEVFSQYTRGQVAPDAASFILLTEDVLPAFNNAAVVWDRSRLGQRHEDYLDWAIPFRDTSVAVCCLLPISNYSAVMTLRI